jgi:hypothetical protein
MAAAFAGWALAPQFQGEPAPYRAGRSPCWIKVKNRKHPSLTREF